MLSHSAVVVGISQVIIISIPVAIPVKIGSKQLIANLSIRLSASLKFLARNFCIL
jgi:hypothetical protein